jgi:hypothetical protein
MIYVLSHVVCHRVRSGGANGDVQQRWPEYLLVEAKRSGATARATLSRRRVASRTACPGVQKRVSSLDYRCPPVHDMSYWPDLSCGISSSGLFEVPFLLPLYRIDHTSSLTTWR